jgi:hypothetical protein
MARAGWPTTQQQPQAGGLQPAGRRSGRRTHPDDGVVLVLLQVEVELGRRAAHQDGGAVVRPARAPAGGWSSATGGGGRQEGRQAGGWQGPPGGLALAWPPGTA